MCPWGGFIFTAQGIVSQSGYAISIPEMIPHCYYPILCIVITIIAIFLPVSKKVFKQPWDFENDCAQQG